MGFGSIWHWLLVILVLVLLFGSGKISGLMGDLAKGIKSFKKEMSEDGAAPEAEPEPEPEPRVIEHRTEKPAQPKPRPAARAKAPRAATKSKSS
jgi:sec-independent protein translocase protein TatA